MMRRTLLLLAVVLLAGPTLACGSSDTVATGSGFRFAASQLAHEAASEPAVDEPPSTLPPGVTQVATAQVPRVEVLTAIPGDASSTIPAPFPLGAGVLPIPRIGYLAASIEKTEQGFLFDNPTYFENPLVFVVVEQKGDWLKVKIPARPNNQVGWIKASDVTLSTHTFRVELSLTDFRLQAWDGSTQIADTKVVIGAPGNPGTPTPVGEFYITEKLPQPNPGGTYGPWIFPTSAYSETLNEFDSGLPVVAMHGTNNPGIIGQARSNGCIRVPNDVINLLAEKLPAGTPFTVVA